MVGLTDQQGKALQLEKHISVTANAGSGKTRVLVERYVAAVRDGAGVGQILCLTFTEKAAFELRQKIGERINSEFASARKNGDPAAARLAEAKRTMLEANISTIHSFCSQLLREFPVEAGIDANYKVLEDFDASSLKEDACAGAVRDSLAEERTGTAVDGARSVHNLLIKVGYQRMLSLLVDLLDNREKIEHARVSGKRIVLDEDALREHWFKMARGVADVIQLNVTAKKGDLSQEISALKHAAADGSTSLSPVLIKLKATLEKILTKAGTPRKKEVVLEGGTKYAYDEALSILQTPYLELKDVSDESIVKDAEGYFKTLNTLVELYVKSESNYTQKKFLMGALDFDDLQILTLRLLSGKETVRKTLSSRFRHVMLDEFQDTNFLQFGIFLSLLEDFTSDARLFVVGDPKQSIYRFRNAQVEVSHSAEQRLSGMSDGLSLPLSESFRMNSDIARFVNNIFREVMKGNKVFEAAGFPSLNQTEYNALIARRPEGGSDPIEIFILEKGGGQDEVSDDENGDADLMPGGMQAMFTAARIREMVDSKEKIRSVKLGEKERDILFSDIAVLLRTRAKLPLLEEAMTKYGIPYVVSAGIGFYSAQEIFDLTNYLTFLLDNNADISLLAVLRSPMFGISENELYATSLVQGGTLYERFLSFSDSERGGEEVRYAASVLREEIELAHRQTIPDLINRILERTGWLGAYSLSPTADQRIANLRKLLGIAREFEGRGFNSLFDFVERIKYLKDTAREGQAPVEEAVDAVKIMTVHAAKGLEFPVVFVPFCDATSRRGMSMIINDQVGILPFVGDEVPAAFSLYKRFEMMNERAEISRLFYVACTRAMDKLVLTTASKKSVRAINSFTDILAKSLDLSAAPAEGYFELDGQKIRAHSTIPNAVPPAQAQAAEPIRMGELFLDPVPADIDGEIYSATLLQTFRLCPTKFFLRYRLGMPTPDYGARMTEAGDALDEYNDAILSTVKGQLVHAVLEQVVSSGDAGDEAINALAKKVVGSMVESPLNDEVKSDLVKVVAENARNAVATLREIAGGGKRYVEQTITRKFGSDFLTGTLDLLMEDDRGFHIYDYKTNRLDKSQEEIYAGYEIQMKLYASLCANLKGGQREFDVTIIFTREPGKYLRKVYTAEDLSRFEAELAGMLGNIKGMETRDGAFPSADSLPTFSPHCSECEYYTGIENKKCLVKRKEAAVVRK